MRRFCHGGRGLSMSGLGGEHEGPGGRGTQPWDCRFDRQWRSPAPRATLRRDSNPEASMFDLSPRLLLALSALLLTACPDNSVVECGDAPEEAIDSFQVTIGTGDDATDADIYFCITRVTDAARDCVQLGEGFEDDFDEGATADYDAAQTVDAGDLDSLWLENRGDAPTLSMDGDDWELDTFRVTAITASGSTLLVEATELALSMDAGDEYEPECSY